MGRTNGTSFVDISDPVNPIYLGNLPPPAGEADERDIKVYADHAFIVTEANDSGMQVFDLTQLRAVASPPATFSETTHYAGFSNAHNLAVNEDSGFAYGNLSEEAFFDVDPGSDSSNYDEGAWSNYPFFDSGIVIVSTIERVLFILRPNLVDGVNPALSSASVNGAALTLTYGEALDGSSTPATDAFTVTVAGSGRTVTHVSVSGRVVTLTLASAVTDGQEVTVTYTVPGTNPIRDAAGNAAEGLSNDPVRNATPDRTPPTISIVLSPGHGVPLNTAITATVTLDNLDPASYSSLVFRADLTEWEQAFARSTHCEGKDTGKDITVEVDASRETVTVEVWKSCSQDIYAYFTLDAALFRLDTSAPGGRVELASAETRFAMSRYLQAGQTAPPPPAPGVAAWLDPDPTSFEWKVGESVVFRGRTDILQYLNHHLGVRGFGPEDGARFADDTDGLDAEEACRNVDDGIVDWRRAIHQPVRFVACRAGEATIEVWHETEAERLSTYEFRVRPADDDEVAAPVITTTSPILVPENETAVATLTAEDQDSTAADLEWSKAGGADAGQFMLSAAGDLAFAAVPDYENPGDADGDRTYEVTVQVSDGDDTDTADIRVTLQNVLELFTELEGTSSTDYAENGAVRVAAYIASSEADRDGIAWSLGGDDAEHFSIDNPAGVLRFHIDPVAPSLFPPPPDFEAPDDKDAKNDYELIVLAQAGSALTLKSVTVTVANEDEAGVVTLSPVRPRVGTALTATLTDPDGSTSGFAWTWERSTGPTTWVAIDGAASSSYTPTAADAGHYLRATATYTDGHGAGKSARAVAPYTPLAHQLSALSVTGPARGMYPAFDPKVLHYAMECAVGNPITLTLSAAESSTRMAVNGVLRPGQKAVVKLTGLDGYSDIPITLTGGQGGATTYVLHCFQEDFPDIATEKGSGATEELIGFSLHLNPTGLDRYGYLVIVDNNGVPRVHRRIGARANHFRPQNSETYPFSYSVPDAQTTDVWVLVDPDLNELDRVTTVLPLISTDRHDFIILDNGDYLLLSYEPVLRDFSSLTDGDGNPLPENPDEPDGRYPVLDTAIQIRTPAGAPKLTWYSWDHMAVQDCGPSEPFPSGDWAHGNSLWMSDGVIVASFRPCGKVVAIDAATGDVVWRLGRSYRTPEEWGRDELSG